MDKTNIHSEAIQFRQQELLSDALLNNYKRIDKQFAILLLLEWIGGIAVAFIVSPQTWAGAQSSTHVHLWAAILLGGLITLFPAFLAWKRPGEATTRYAVAVGQVAFSGLLIHLTGGRIEAHFHIFVSLGFLAMYRDWKVLIIATVVVAGDHLWRGVFWPESVFGVLTSSPWRVVEHALWVVFEDIGLLRFCYFIREEMAETAQKQAEVEVSEGQVKELLEEVQKTTKEMAEKQKEVTALHGRSEREKQFLIDGIDILKEYARGDLSRGMSENENDRVGLAEVVNGIRRQLNALLTECQKISIGSARGDLETRGNQEAFSGQFRNIVEEINNTLENIQSPVRSAIFCLDGVSEGDLNRRIDNNFQGDFERLKESVNHSSETIGRLVANFQEAIISVSSEAREMSSSSKSLSDGAAQQAASISEITENIRDIETQTKHSIANASKVNELSHDTAETANQGNHKMVNMLSAMRDISEDSAKISNIVKTIDEIAFQTNLLALNAAVEAARAGVHGKGFAVVAEEVRSLAQRSAKAAQETTELIAATVDRVNRGNDAASETAASLEVIVRQTSEVSQFIKDITQSIDSQSKGINQIRVGLDQISSVTHQNTAGAEEIAAVSGTLESRSNELKQIAEEFRLSNIKTEKNGSEFEINL